ncbi:MAG: AMP-binding protein, partial [Pseudomonadota bacterium]
MATFPIDGFRNHAETRPNSPALRDGRSEITYRGLQTRADAVSSTLRAHGVVAGDRVALGLEPGGDLIAAMIGILQLGAAYVPVDPRAPKRRNRMILQDCAPRLALLDRGVEAGTDGVCPVINPMDATDAIGSAVDRPQAAWTAETTAYVIYTSGTTGRPKGVPVSHGSMRALFAATETAFHFGPDDRGVLYHSHAFDFSVWEIWSMLAYGGCLCIPDYRQKTTASEFADFLAVHRITVLNQTPSSFGLNAPEIVALGAEKTALRVVVFGGERLNMALLQSWVEAFPLDRVAMINMYGITETTVHSSCYRVRRTDLNRTDSPIGQMLPGFQTRLR